MMKLKGIAATLFAAVCLLGLTPHLTFAAFVSGSTGADGAFEPAASTALQIPESGVFNFTTVNIPSGVTVTFRKNTQNTPVTILATGDVTIEGTISVNGSNGSNIIPGAGGPGGFDGGQGGVTLKIGKRGEGPGGGGGGSPRTDTTYAGAGGGGGGFCAAGGSGLCGYISGGCGSGGAVYGNERVLPLIGGSGGGGGGGTTGYVGGAGGGGGGSIIIASSGTMTIGGSITANGGAGARGEYSDGYGGGGGGGSGGGIRLIANTISGSGAVNVTGGGGAGSANGWGNGGSGSYGRIRMEYSSITGPPTANPKTALSTDYPYAVVPPNMPILAITSIGGIDVPAVTSGGYGSPDVMLPFNAANPITIVVTGTNIPAGQTVTVKASPSVGSGTSVTGVLAGTDTSSSVSVQLNLASAYPSIITATVTFELTAASGGPIYAQGERVDRIRVAANIGGNSTVTYITESGREIVAM